MIEHTWRELERADMDAAAAHAFDEERRAAMTELLPCPFCGGEAKVCEGGINGKMRVYGLVEHKDGCFFLADGLPTKYQHIMESDFDAWNTRAERTCRIEGRYGNQYCTCCGEMVGTWDSTSELYIDGNMVELWNYCPSCGAKVVE